jgi:hypothetical protein
MSAAETVYTARIPYPDVIERGRLQTVALEMYRDGALVAPTQAGSTLTIYDPSNTAIVSAAAITVTSSIATYAIPALSLPATLALGEGYLQEWSLIMPGDTVPRVYRRTMALALRSLFPVITDADLTAEYPDLVTQLAGVMTHLQSLIDEAWKRIVRRVIRSGRYTYQIMDADSFADWHRELVHHLAFKAMFRASPNDRHRELYLWHFEKAKAEAASLSFTEDADHDGRADTAGRSSLGKVVHINVSPRARRRATNKW